MKKILTATLMAVVVAGQAYASEVLVDDTFSQTKTWLSQQNLAVTGSSSGARNDLAAYGQEAILFYGEAVGNPDHRTMAQREMMAKRAAVVTAQRSLAEYMEGFALVGDTYVKDGMTQYDAIRSAVASLVKGTQVVFQEYNKEKDIAIAFIKLGLHGPDGFASTLYKKMETDPTFRKGISSDKPDFKPAPNKIEQVNPDISYDGLIIDATEQNFRPALINRIFTAKGEILYDPAKISQKVLVEQGCGEYTNSVDKAKTVLASRGVINPLVLKASGATNRSDLQVSDEDSLKVFAANQKGDFLAGAKVAFVLK